MAKRKPDFDSWLAEGRKILTARKKELQAELTQIEKQISRLAGAPARKPRRKRRVVRRRRKVGRPRAAVKRRRAVRATAAGGRRKKLPELVRLVLGRSRGPRSIKQIEAAVLKAGYQTKAASIYNAVYTTLQGIGAKRVGRGQYVAGRASGAKPTRRKKVRRRRLKKTPTAALAASTP